MADVNVKYDGIDEPTVKERLRNILDDYHHNGQILTELLQNAEDAGASMFKVLYDGRNFCTEQTNDETKPYQTFFRGPALIVYNDAEFSDDDWKGIKKFGKSTKKQDSTKIGRFGLGFKTVFHLTDYAVIISGQRLLMIDPLHEDAKKVFQLLELQHISEGFINEYLTNFFWEAIGFCQDTVDRGRFSGTLFLFPLRNNSSALSNNVYDESKIKCLFDTFLTNASDNLIFLHSLESVEVYLKDSKSIKMPADGRPYLVLNIVGSDLEMEQLNSERRQFNEKIKMLCNRPPDAALNNEYEIKIQTKVYNVTDERYEKTENAWLIINRVKGLEEMSTHFKELCVDKSLAYYPYASVAVLLSLESVSGFIGRVFCFVPLPLGTESQTGLPFHINGCFALEQNRQHLKWLAGEVNTYHMDKFVQWNRCLVEEVIPEVYALLIDQLISRSIRNGNDDSSVALVTRCIPIKENVTDKWRISLQHLYRSLLKLPFLFPRNDKGQWILHSDAVFATYDDSTLSSDVRKTLLNLLKQCKKNIVDVPSHVFNIVRENSPSLASITPDYMRKILKSSLQYTKLTTTEKIQLLQFVLKDEQYKKLEDLELLPLENGKFVTFVFDNSVQERVFVSDKSTVSIFPGMEGRFVMTGLPAIVQHHLANILKQDHSQVLRFTSLDFVTLLEETMKSHRIDTTFISLITQPSALDRAWISSVWHYIGENFQKSLHEFGNIRILFLKQHRGNSFSFHVLSGLYVLKSFDGMSDLPEDVCTCLQNLSATVIQDLPDFILSHPLILPKFVSYPNQEGVIAILKRLANCSNLDDAISNFNKNCNASEKKSFLNYLGNCFALHKLDGNTKQVLKKLEIFCCGSEKERVAISQIQEIAPPDKVPVFYPKKLIACPEINQRQLAIFLGARELDLITLTKKILICLENSKLYSTNDKQKFMSYIMKNIIIFEKDLEIIQMASKVRFVSTPNGTDAKPCELFDSRDKLLAQFFQDRNRFPYGEYELDSSMCVLAKLGLKSISDLSSNDVFDCALHLHKQNDFSNKAQDQAMALITVLQKRPDLLHQNVYENNDTKLKSALGNLCFIISKMKPYQYQYPQFLDWYKGSTFFSKPCEMLESKYFRLVGSVAPLIPDDISDFVAKNFECMKHPSTEKVIEQLKLIIDKYENRYKPELLPLITGIYTFLSGSNISDKDIEIKRCIWTGDDFCEPWQLYVKANQNDISLKPYLFKLPDEFESLSQIHHFFINLGSFEFQDCDALKHIQQRIRMKYDACTKKTKTEIEQDLKIIETILNKLAQEPQVERKSEILFPVHSDVNGFSLKPGKECRYCNEDWLKDILLEEGEEISFVHPSISHEVAEKLGVQSLTNHLMAGTEEFQSWGQKEPLTRRIRDILKSYNDGFCVPKEIIQNADDAGASKVCFLYDERENLDYRTRLLDDNMQSFQGPALWSYNDATFTDTDLKNIIQLSGATKEEDESKIGKFGLGFCSVYNLTDVPSFVSGKNIVFFDPHAKYLGKAAKNNTGIKINMEYMENKTLIRGLTHQFQPFDGTFGCDMSMTDKTAHFDGTLFRFPLRTASQASVSEICQRPYGTSEMKTFLEMFMSFGGTLLLFTQHVTDIEIYHLPSNECKPEDKKLIYSVTRRLNKTIGSSSYLFSKSTSKISIVKELSELMLQKRARGQHNEKKVQLCTEVEITVEVHPNGRSLEFLQNISTTKWLIAWASGTKESMEMARKMFLKKALPLTSVAVLLSEKEQGTLVMDLHDSPFGFYAGSHFFCYLPLPEECPLPVHINGSFAVSGNRKQLCCTTVDDISSNESQWNEALMKDAVCNAYLFLLENFKEFGISFRNGYWELWPIAEDQFVGILKELQKTFLKMIVEDDPAVFKLGDTWESFTNCKFLDTSLTSSDVGKIALSTGTYFTGHCDYTIMEFDVCLRNCFECAGYEQQLAEHIITTESFYQDIFFPNIHCDYWDGKEDARNKLTLYALGNKVDQLHQLVKQNRCIPSKPNGILKMPEELIHPSGSVKVLFDVEDEMFIKDDDNNQSFVQIDILEVLVSMGLMKNSLTDKLLLDRAHSVTKLATFCSKCALDKCGYLLNYLSTCPNNAGLGSKDIFNELSKIPFLPVLPKPSNWQFPWKGSYDDCEEPKTRVRISKRLQCIQLKHSEQNVTTEFEKPSILYSSNVVNLVGCVRKIFDGNSVPHIAFPNRLNEFFCHLGIRGKSLEKNVPLYTVMEQILSICQVETSKLNKNSMKDLTLIYEDICRFFNTTCALALDGEQKRRVKALLNYLIEYPIFLINDRFIEPGMTALHLSVDCTPCLYGINDNILHLYDHFLQVLDVKVKYSTKDILNVIVMSFKDSTLTTEHLDLYCRLLGLMTDSIQQEDQSEDILQACKERLRLPDDDLVLRPIDELCVDDADVTTRPESMKFVHEKISREQAMILGIRSKERKKLMDHSLKIFFGQKEDLTTRIKRILSGYPCDENIFKELLQNADDAGATEVNIIKDYKFHLETENEMFGENWNLLQGPALLVYNNSSFNQEDIKGIQNLGVGSKSHDPTKTGKYGIGFNAVYHLTDVPSFLTKGPESAVKTGETLCVLDPHCHYVPESTRDNPGMQYINLKELKEASPNAFACYHENILFQEEKGTIFRLPLRTSTMAERSEISQSIVTTRLIDSLIDKFKREMFEMLLFTNSVQKVTVSDVTQGNLNKEYTVKVIMSADDDLKRKEFANYARKTSEILSKSHSILQVNEREVRYIITVQDSEGKMQSWLIVNRIGIDKDLQYKVAVEAYHEGKIGMLPVGGVAIALPSSLHDKQKNFQIFCLLPLPTYSGLPLHINGHFALDHEARRNLWEDRKDNYRSSWNKLLICEVITPAYVTAVQEFKCRLGLRDGIIKNAQINRALTAYHLLFPEFKTVSSNYWKLLISSFYRKIVEDQSDVFASHFCKVVQNQTIEYLKFYPLRRSGHQFSAVFNNLKYQLTRNQDKPTEIESYRVNLLTEICTKLSMKLLDSPLKIYRAMKEAKIPDTTVIRPDIVVDFLRSFRDVKIADRCHFGRLHGNVSETTLISTNNVLEILQYCVRSESFHTKVEGLPLCLTNDNVLTEFNVRNPVFCTKYSYLLPEISSKFLHRDIVAHREIGEYMQDRLADLNVAVFQPFDIHALSKYRPTSLPDKESVEWQAESKDIPNSEWLLGVWKFLYDCIKPEIGIFPDEETKRDKIMQLLESISSWCLLPCIQSTKRLIQIKFANKILLKDSFSGYVRVVFEKLNFLDLDKDYSDVDVFQLLLTVLVASNTKPYTVLECLHLHQQKLQNTANLTAKDCFAILEYLSMNLKDILSRSNSEDIKHKLKSIPLHVTLQKSRIALKNCMTVMVLPAVMPWNGITELGESTCITFLEHSTKLESMHSFLGYTQCSAYELYQTYLLPNFHHMPLDSRIIHLHFIRDELLAKAAGLDYNSEQLEIIDKMTDMKLFFKEGFLELQKASDFLSSRNDVFAKMCKSDAFPQHPFSEEDWIDFMERIGMIKHLDAKRFVNFAEQVEYEARYRPSQETREKSKLLVNYLIETAEFDIFENSFLPKISEIKFIAPFEVPEAMQQFHRECDDDNNFICFSGSVVEWHWELVWTSCKVLPCASRLKNMENWEEVIRQLKIVERPDIKKVVLHIQNLTSSMIEQFNQAECCLDTKEVESLMIYLYNYLLRNGSSKSYIIKQRLTSMPILFLPSHQKFVTCDKVVRELNENDTIEPYLYPLPENLDPYIWLFELLGSTQQPTCDTYGRVLKNLYLAVIDQELDMDELRKVKQAVYGLFNILKASSKYQSETALSVNTIYLPSRNKCLVDSKKLLYSDMQLIEQKLINVDRSSIFLGFWEMNMEFENGREYIKMLPDKYRPKILSEQLKFTVDTSSIEVVDGDKSKHLLDLIRSSEFEEGILRLVMHKCQESNTQGITEQILTQVKAIQVHQVAKLERKTEFQETVVDVEVTSFAFVQEENSYCFYFSIDSDNWLQIIESEFALMLNECTNDILGSQLVYVIPMLHCIDSPSRIPEVLDRAKVTPYHMSAKQIGSSFPPPGTIVPATMHYTLINPFSEFKSGEDVAIHLLDDENRSGVGYAEEYIYAIIKNKVDVDEDMTDTLDNSFQMYNVNTGKVTTDEIPAYKIYKFHKFIPSTSIVLEEIGHIQQIHESSSRSMQDIYQQVRHCLNSAWTLPEEERKIYIKRLLRQWHRDKNCGFEKVADEMFKYIKDIVSQLSNEVGIDDIGTSMTSDTCLESPLYQKWFDDVERSCRRDKEYGQQQSDEKDRRSIDDRHIFSHSYSARSEPVSQPPEARRWYRQACGDLEAARRLMSLANDIKAYNWVCYNCHQSAEKALKAVWFYKDANRVSREHCLTYIADELEQELKECASSLDSLLGNDTNMRYPDRWRMPKIPSDMYDEDKSKRAIEITQKLCETVSNIVGTETALD